MRPKVLIIVLLFGCFVVVALLLFRGGSPNTAPGVDQGPADQTSDVASSNSDTTMKPTTTAPPPLSLADMTRQGASAESKNPLDMTPEEKHEAYVATRVQELDEMGTSGDLDSLNTLLSELGNREPEIRKAALEAIVQFGSRDVIPKLEDAELQVDDPHEKAAIADAIEFLQLPTLLEYRAAVGGAPAH
jgi:hypothetical protein